MSKNKSNVTSLQYLNILCKYDYYIFVLILFKEDSNSYQESYENKKIIEFALKKLPEPDKTVISLYYMEGEQRKNIAQRLNVSPTQISRILRRALNKLYIIIENEMNDKIKA